MSGQLIRFPVERTRPERLLTSAQLCEHLGFKSRWLRYRVKEGLPAKRWGNSLRFNLSEVERWLEDRQSA